jgi:hypothetical protein
MYLSNTYIRHLMLKTFKAYCFFHLALKLLLLSEPVIKQIENEVFS